MKKIVCDKCKEEEIVTDFRVVPQGWFHSYFLNAATGKVDFPHPKANDLCVTCAVEWFRAGNL